MEIVRDVEAGRESGTLIPKVIKEGINLRHSSSQAELGASSEEGVVEADITVLEEGEKSVNLLVRRDVFHEGNEAISHGHVVGICFTDKTNGGLGVNGAVKGGCKVGILEDSI